MATWWKGLGILVADADVFGDGAGEIPDAHNKRNAQRTPEQTTIRGAFGEVIAIGVRGGRNAKQRSGFPHHRSHRRAPGILRNRRHRRNHSEDLFCSLPGSVSIQLHQRTTHGLTLAAR